MLFPMNQPEEDILSYPGFQQNQRKIVLHQDNTTYVVASFDSPNKYDDSGVR